MRNKSKLVIIGLIAAVACCVSCEKRYELSSLNDFEVKAEKSSYVVGDTVKFLISGSAGNIVFWSGETGHIYEYRDRTVMEGNQLLLDFKTFSQYGEVDQENIKILISNDFDGVYDSAHVAAATWKDISDRAVFSAGQDQTPSGEINLDDFGAANKDMTLAFQYKTKTVKPATDQNRWVIRSFNLSTVNPAGETTPVFNMANAGWVDFNFAGPSTSWVISSSQLITSRNFTELDDDWVLTKRFNPNKVSPDRGTPVKNISQSILEYTTVYKAPGTYKVTFVGTNANIKHAASSIKELTVTINE